MRRAGTAVAAALFAACSSSGSPSGPDGPPFTLRVEYVQGAGSQTPTADPGCAHHYAPSNLTLMSDWGEQIRLQQAGDRRFTGTLARVPAGSRWVNLIDIIYCGSPAGAAAPSGLSVGGVELRRFADRGDGVPALLFSVTERGIVQP